MAGDANIGISAIRELTVRLEGGRARNTGTVPAPYGAGTWKSAVRCCARQGAVTGDNARGHSNLPAAVSDILTISGDNIQPAPENAPDRTEQCARGPHVTDRRMVCPIETVGFLPDRESEAA